MHPSTIARIGQDTPDHDSVHERAATSLRAAIGDLHLPRVAHDGDCIVISDQIVDALTSNGVAARTLPVWGWANEHDRVLAFGHVAVTATPPDDPGVDWIIDATATQYDPTLPHLIITTPDRYLALLAEATGTTVTVDRPNIGRH